MSRELTLTLRHVLEMTEVVLFIDEPYRVWLNLL